MSSPSSLIKTVQVSFAECVGTALFSMVSYMELANLAVGGGLFAAGFALLILYYGFRHISGAHLNPAVSVAFFLSETKNFGILDLISRLCSQILGGIVGGLLGVVIARSEIIFPFFTTTADLARPFFMLVIGTMVFTSVYLHLYKQSDPECSDDFGGIAVGFSYIAVSLSLLFDVIGLPPVFNPATALGFAMANIQDGAHPLNLWIYWVGPMVGALLAAALYRILYNWMLSGWEGGSPVCLSSALLIEGLGTFALVYAAGTGSTGLAPGFTLISMVFMGGYISGAEYNPAVTLAVALKNKTPVKEVAARMGTQIVAGFLAGCIAYGLKKKEMGYPNVPPGSLPFGAWLFEAVFTSFLAYSVLTATSQIRKDVPNTGNSYFGLAIGGTVTAGALVGGAHAGGSGGCFNPAVGFGLDIPASFNGFNIEYVWIYLTAPLIGSCVAYGMFNFFHAFKPVPSHDEETEMDSPATPLLEQVADRQIL